MLCTKFKGLLGAAALIVGAAAALGQTTDSTPKQDRLEAAWAELASTDEARSTRALLLFAAAPKEATAFLKSHLRPVRVNGERIADLVARMGDDRFQVREMAYKELEAEAMYLGKYAKPNLEKLMAGAGQEAKNRLRRLIDQLPTDAKPAAALPKLAGRSVSVNNVNGNIKIVIDGVPLDLAATAPPPPGPNMAWVRAVRATVVLETFGTPEARAIINDVAGGETEALPTREAKNALERLGGSR